MDDVESGDTIKVTSLCMEDVVAVLVNRFEQVFIHNPEFSFRCHTCYERVDPREFRAPNCCPTCGQYVPPQAPKGSSVDVVLSDTLEDDDLLEYDWVFSFSYYGPSEKEFTVLGGRKAPAK